MDSADSQDKDVGEALPYPMLGVMWIIGVMCECALTFCGLCGDSLGGLCKLAGSAKGCVWIPPAY